MHCQISWALLQESPLTCHSNWPNYPSQMDQGLSHQARRNPPHPQRAQRGRKARSLELKKGGHNAPPPAGIQLHFHCSR
ncbi:hypothetical protein MHYP_G00025200 [Metynnis hypsauchen]